MTGGSDASIIIDVEGRRTGALLIKKDLDNISSSGERATGTMGILKTAVIALGGSAVISSLVRMNDSYTEMTNKLRVATGNQDEFNAALRDVKDIAKDTFTPIEAVASAYSRFELATKDLGKSQKEVADFTKAVALTFKVSGANAVETSSAMIQLGQALASGRLSGDEFRSVSESNSEILTILADKLGVARGELKQMATDGLLTADVLFDALVPALDGLNQKADQITPTVAKAFQTLKDQVMLAIGESQSLDVVMGGLTGTILLVANNIDVISEAIGALAVALSITLASKAIPAAITALLSITATIKGMTLATIGFNSVAIGAAGMIGILAAVGAAGYIFRDELSATVIFIVNEAANAVDNLIVKLKNLATQASTGLSATAAAIQNTTGLLSDEDYQKRLLQLGKEQNESIVDGNQALKERIQLRDAELQRSLEALGNKGSSPSAIASGTQTGNNPVAAMSKGTKELKKDLESLINSSKTDYEKLVEDINKVNEAKKSGLISEADSLEVITALRVKYADSINTGTRANQDLNDSLKTLIDQNDQFKNSVADTFAQFATGAMTAKNAVRSLIQEFLAMQMRSSFGGAGLGGLLSGAIGAVSGGGFFGSQGLFNRLSVGGSADFVGPLPKFANGGSMTIGGNPGVDKNLLSLNGNPIAKVGKGETLSVSPNGSSGSIIVNQTINVSTGVQQTVRSEILNLMPQIKAAAVSGVQDATLRGAIA